MLDGGLDGEFAAGVAFAEVIFLGGLVLFEAGEGAGAGVVVDVGDDVLGEIEDAVEVTARDIEEQAEVGGDAAGIPDVGDGGGELDVAHALAADGGAGDFDAALVADDALVADVLVFTAVALPVLGGAKDGLAEEAVFFGPQAAIVDRLRLGDLAVGPLADVVGRGEADPQ